jgi:hypothetical protein
MTELLKNVMIVATYVSDRRRAPGFRTDGLGPEMR